jgi:hypothetical protein
MNQHYNRFYIAGVLLLLLSGLSLMLVPGCSKSTVAVSGTSAVDEQLAYLNTYFSPNGPQLGEPLDSLPVILDTVLTGQIGQSGGIFQLKDEMGDLHFRIPAKALEKEINITIHAIKYKASFGPFWLLDCGPEGTVFAKPLEVASVGNASKTRILFYFNEKSSQWEVEEIAVDSGSLEINHFSKYAISE